LILYYYDIKFQNIFQFRLPSERPFFVEGVPWENPDASLLSLFPDWEAFEDRVKPFRNASPLKLFSEPLIGLYDLGPRRFSTLFDRVAAMEGGLPFR